MLLNQAPTVRRNELLLVSKIMRVGVWAKLIKIKGGGIEISVGRIHGGSMPLDSQIYEKPSWVLGAFLR